MKDAPWLTKKEWKDNYFFSGAKTEVYVIWGFTAVWNLISLPILFTTDNLFDEIARKPETALVLLFPLIGLVLFMLSIKALVSLRKFGRTPLTLDPFPGSVGGHVGGKILTNIQYEPSLSYRVTLACIHSYMSGSGKNRSRKEDVVWQSEGVCCSNRTGRGTELSFRFSVPENLPESDVKSGSSYRLWRVSVSCELSGADFERQFEIPVFSGVRHSSELTIATEKYHRTIEMANNGIYQIAQIQELPGGGLEFYYPPAKRPAGGIMACIFGLIFSGAGLVMWNYTDAPILFPITFTPIGIFILMIGIWTLGKSLRVRIDRNRLTARRFFFKYPITTRSIGTQDIAMIREKEGSSISSGKKTTVYYQLVAHTNDRQCMVLAERLCSKPEVQIIRRALEHYIPGR